MANVMIDEKDFMRLVKLLNGMELSSDELSLLKEHMNSKMTSMVKRQQYRDSLNRDNTPS